MNVSNLRPGIHLGLFCKVCQVISVFSLSNTEPGSLPPTFPGLQHPSLLYALWWELRFTCGFHDCLQTDDFWSFLPRLSISWTSSEAFSLVSHHTSTLICPKLNSLCPLLLLTKPNTSHHSRSCSSYKLQPWGQQSHLHSHLRPGTRSVGKIVQSYRHKKKSDYWYG